MLLNSKNSSFIFSFPQGWFDKEIEDRYKMFFERRPIIYKDLTDYMSYTVQSVSWPAFTGETVSQTAGTMTRTFKSGENFIKNIQKELRVTFRTVEGFLNFFVMFDVLQKYWTRSPDAKTFLPDLRIFVLDHYGYLMMTVLMKNIVFKGISELELSFASNIPEYRTFECIFEYSGLEFIRALT